MLDVIVTQSGVTIHMGNSTDAVRALNEDKAFHLIVFCAKEFGPPPQVLDHSRDRRQTRVYHAPMDDANITRDEMFMASQAAKIVAAAFLKRKRILVTCHEGRNRSGLVVALALDILSSEGGEAAFNAVRERRRRAKGPALTNPTFATLLKNIPPRTTGPRAIVLGTGPQRALVL